MRYGVLGVGAAWARDGVAVPLGGARIRALLVALAGRAGRAVAPQVLVDDVWADEPPADAVGALQALVARLRKALGREAVASEPGGYRLDVAREAVDVFAFEALLAEGEAALREGRADGAAEVLDRALGLWRGPAFADLPAREAAAARPEAQRVAARRLRFEADLVRGRAADVLPALREAVAERPLDEPFHAQLIRALRGAGRPADALVAYEEARAALAETLGTDPGPELRALHAELLAVPAGAAPAPVAATRGAPAAPTVAGGPRRGNLRARLTSFVGRESELAAIRGDLRAARLVTLTGPGGSGKTRLAQEAGEAAQDAYADGVWLAELAPLDSPEAVPHAVLSALGRRGTVVLGTGRDPLTSEPHADDPVERLVEHCAERRLLLLLDNCEHLVEPAARLAAELLARCPGLTVLATSREPLGVQGELVRPVEPLPPPTAYRLFAERARAVRPGAVPQISGAAGPSDASGAPAVGSPGEGVFVESAGAVRPGAVPQISVVAGPSDASGAPAVGSPGEGVFVELAGAVRPGGAPQVPGAADRSDASGAPAAGSPHDDGAAAAWEICRRLDGLPLAIELAAARLRALSPRQIADRLDDRFRLLTGGSRTLLPRQQRLRAVVDWSWELLDEAERAALRALSVFSGGCTLAAAEAVCGPDTLDTLTQLVDKSLVVADHDRVGGTRYQLLETIHEYAAERAREVPGELAAARARHTAYVRDLVVDVDAKLRGADQLRWFEVLESELDNVRAALHRAVEERDEAPALAIAVAMGWFWWLRNYRDEAAGWLTRVAALGEEPRDRADPLFWPRTDLRMLLFFVQAEAASEAHWASPEVKDAARRLSAAYRDGGAPAARFPGLVWPFTSYITGADTSGMRALSDLVVDNCRTHGGDWEVATALMLRVHVTVDSPGGIDRTDADRAELDRLVARLDDRWIRAQVHSARGEISSFRGDYAAARADYEAAHRLGRELGAFSEGAFLLARTAELAFRGGQYAEADELLAAAGTEAERFAVLDARTYIRFLTAQFRLHQGRYAEARASYDQAVGRMAEGTPPPMFHVLLQGMAARLHAAEGDLPEALAQVAGSLRLALEVRCIEPVVATQLDTAAQILLAMGDPAVALCLCAAGTAVRGTLPRSVPEQSAADALRTAAAKALPAAAFAEAEAEGARLTAEEAAALLGARAAA
ncbi:BTAD domain-containing putative transcriptional regulator [Actinacidiphila guanduensis]|uniref:BTAD domain-containing putative transcriptional regulator n=1 Tax=Actinacidiphila guanduensis TaxID=310781 RepID=UPI0038991BE8